MTCPFGTIAAAGASILLNTVIAKARV